jgi:putative ABC transport system permease protein
VIEENMGQLFPQFGIPPRAMVMAFGLSVVLGAAAAILPAYQASKLKVVDALRRVA